MANQEEASTYVVNEKLHQGDEVTNHGMLRSGLEWIFIRLGPDKRALKSDEGEHYILRATPKGVQTSEEDDTEMYLLARRLAIDIQSANAETPEARKCRLALNLGLATAKDYWHAHVYAVRMDVKVMRLLDSIVVS